EVHLNLARLSQERTGLPPRRLLKEEHLLHAGHLLALLHGLSKNDRGLAGMTVIRRPRHETAATVGTGVVVRASVIIWPLFGLWFAHDKVLSSPASSSRNCRCCCGGSARYQSMMTARISSAESALACLMPSLTNARAWLTSWPMILMASL